MPKLASFSLTLDYSQMCIYDPSLEFPGNDWDDQHVEQGFTWRPFSVSFSAIGSDDDCDIEIWGTPLKSVSNQTLFAQLPFLFQSRC